MSEITGEKMQDIYDAAVRVEFNEKQGKSEDATFDFLCVMGADLAEVSATVRKLIDMVRARDAELLAVREAQPVAWQQRFSGDHWQSCSKSMFDYLSENPDPIVEVREVYAAPPAPAVIDERLEFESFMENRFRDSVNRSRAMNGDSEYFAWDMQVAWRAWQGRAAMLTGGKS